MRRFTILLVLAALLALSLAMVSQSGAKRGHKGHKVSASLGVGSGSGLTPSQLANHGWTCFDVPNLGIHCAPPGKPWPPSAPNNPPVIQLLYFIDGVHFSGTETLMRKDIYLHGTPPCPFQGGSWTDLTALDLPDYLGCHRR